MIFIFIKLFNEPLLVTTVNYSIVIMKPILYYSNNEYISGFMTRTGFILGFKLN